MDQFLAQFIGLYFMIVGALVLVRGKTLLPAVSEIGNNRPVMLMIGTVELAAGLALVLTYPTVSLSPMGLLSLVGYVMTIEGVMYFSANAFMQKVLQRFNKKQWYIIGGIVAIGLGAYLLNYGFDLGFF